MSAVDLVEGLRVVARRAAERLAVVDGIAAVVMGGSLARGEADARSDVDLGVYYHRGRPLDVEALRALARELDDRHPPDAVTDIGGWGPWINGGGWLLIDGLRVDWLYRDLTLVADTIADCEVGRFASGLPRRPPRQREARARRDRGLRMAAGGVHGDRPRSAGRPRDMTTR